MAIILQRKETGSVSKLRINDANIAHAEGLEISVLRSYNTFLGPTILIMAQLKMTFKQLILLAFCSEVFYMTDM